MCQKCIQWTLDEKHAFLRQALEVRLVSLQLEVGNYKGALSVGQPLLKELKRLDDKSLLVEVQLMESRCYYALSNYPKSRCAPPRRAAHAHASAGLRSCLRARRPTASTARPSCKLRSTSSPVRPV